jgi:hypothetical protein
VLYGYRRDFVVCAESSPGATLLAASGRGLRGPMIAAAAAVISLGSGMSLFLWLLWFTSDEQKDKRQLRRDIDEWTEANAVTTDTRRWTLECGCIIVCDCFHFIGERVHCKQHSWQVIRQWNKHIERVTTVGDVPDNPAQAP